MIITIGRRMGSGGLLVAQSLAERLGLRFYDKELLLEAAKESGICSECFREVDEQARKAYGGVGLFGMRFPFVSDGGGSTLSALSGDNLFLVQSETIRHLAEQEQGAVIVGRCADYVLRDREDLLSVFVTASDDDCIRRIALRSNCSDDDARSIMRKTNKQRAAYYDYFASREWGVASSYDICVSSSKLGIDGCVDLITDAVAKLGK